MISALSAGACGGNEDGSNVEAGSGDDADGKGDTVDQPDLGGDGSGLNGGSGTKAPTVTRGSECVSDSSSADAIPAVVQLVVDTSGSMEWAPGETREPRANEESKWEITSRELKKAVAELPGTVALGLNFYPNTNGDRPCFRGDVEVPIALLGPENSPQRRSFNQAIDRARVDGGTPTHAAYRFGAGLVADAELEGRKFVLLITDGVPTFTSACRGDGRNPVENEPLIEEARSVFAQQGIGTFVIGSPGSEAARGDLSRIASVGGTATPSCSDSGPNYCHLDMTQAADFGSALADGLAEIAGRISACEYKVPPPPGDRELALDTVNVIYTKGDGTEVPLTQDASGMCTSGWVYAENSTVIQLCGADCDAVKADPGAKVELLFGCKTNTSDPIK
jgi:hypothetical protein